MKQNRLAAIFALVVLVQHDGVAGTEKAAELPAAPKKPKAIAIDTNRLEALPYDAGRVKIIASSEDTNGASAVMELTELPGYKTAWHRHKDMDEAYYVLEGIWTVRIGDRTLEFPAGSYVLIPRGTAHGQGNFSRVPVRLLLTVTPGGFERFFRDRVDLFEKTRPGDHAFQAKFDAIRAKHQAFVEILGTWEP